MQLYAVLLHVLINYHFPNSLAGLVADCSLTDYVPASCAPGTTDNDGLWTSIAVAAEAFRYQVTADPDAQINAWDLFLGMQFLNNVRTLTQCSGCCIFSIHVVDVV